MCISSLMFCTVAGAIANGDTSPGATLAIDTLSIDTLQLIGAIEGDVLKLTSSMMNRAIATPETFQMEQAPFVTADSMTDAIEWSDNEWSDKQWGQQSSQQTNKQWDQQLNTSGYWLIDDFDARISVTPAFNDAELGKQQPVAVDFHEGGRGELSRSRVEIEDVVLPSFPVLPIDFVFPAETYIEVDEGESSNSPLTDEFRVSLEAVTPRVQLLRDFLIIEPPLFETPISGAALMPPAPSPFFPPTTQGPTNDICAMRSLYPPNPRRPGELQRLDLFCLSTDAGDSRRFIADYGANDGDPYGRSLILGAIQVSDDPVQTATSVRLQLAQTTQQVRELEAGQDISLETWASAVEQCLVSQPRLYTIDATGSKKPILFDGREGRIELNQNGRPFCPG